MRISQIAGSFILGLAATIGSQNIGAENKSNPTTLSKRNIEDKPKQTQKETTLKELFKKVEDLPAGTKERKDTLEFLKQTAIAQAKSPNKSKIGLKLIEILNKKKETDNLQELIPIIFSIVKEQAIINGKILAREKNGEIKLIEFDKAIGEPLSKTLLNILFDTNSSRDLREEARTQFATLLNEPFCYTEPFFSFHREKLKSLSELPEDRFSEIGKDCEKLTEIHRRLMGDLSIGLQKELVPHFKKLLEINLNLIKDDDEKLAIAEKNLTGLSELFLYCNLWYAKENKYYIANNVKAYELCFPFFKKVLWEKEIIPPKRIESLIKISEALLDFSWIGEQDNPITVASNKLYVNWLTNQTNNSMKDKSRDNLERQKILEFAIRNEIHDHKIVPKLRGELFKTLIDKYTELTNHNISDADFLDNALGTFAYLKDYTYNYYSELNDNNKKELGNAALSLFYLTCDGIEKLSDTKDLKKLKGNLLKTPGFIDSVDKKNLDKCLDYLSTILCKESSTDSEEFMQVVRSLLDTNLKSPETTWSPYLLHNFMASNLDYFEKNTVKIIDTYKNPSSPDLKTKSLKNITELYLFFHQIHRIGKYVHMARITPTGFHKHHGDTDLTPSELKSIYKKTNALFIEKLDKPLVEIILNDLATQKDDEKCKEFNKILQKIENCNLSVTHQDRKGIILQNLKTINPYFQKLNHTALEQIISSDLEDSILINILKDAVARETSLKVLQNIGRVISYGTVNNLDMKKEFNFFQGLHNIDKRKKLNPKDTTPFHNFIIELVRITEGDSDISKSYLPNHSFTINKDGKINLKDFNAFMRLRRNAFFTLSSLANEQSEYLYKPLTVLYRSKVLDLLENRFERYATPDTIIQTWGEQTAALVSVYSNTKETFAENTTYINSKLDFLKKRFFDGNVPFPLFNAVLEHEFIELNPKKNRKVLDDIYHRTKLGKEVREAILKEAPSLEAKYTEMRKQFGLAFIKALSTQNNGYLDEHLNYLRQLGFKDYEVTSVAKAVIESK